MSDDIEKTLEDIEALFAQTATYTVDMLEGSLPAKGELVSIFIDPFGRPLSPVSLAGST